MNRLQHFVSIEKSKHYFNSLAFPFLPDTKLQFARCQCTVDSKQMFNIKFADDWIRTSDLCYQKRPLRQLNYFLSQT